MKQGTRPTRRQKIAIKEAGLILENWLVERDTPKEMVVVHKYTNEQRRIPKGI